jgi:uncharacterized protein YigE (DUF2233 family)
VVRAAPARWVLRAVPAPAGQLRRVDARWAQEPGAVVAWNGGFFDTALRPMGLRVDQGRAWGPLLESDQGVFWARRGRLGVTHVGQWGRGEEEVEFALQAGPRLLVDGELLRLRPNLAARTVMGVDWEGRLVVVVMRGEVTLDALAQALRAPVGAGGLRLRSALNLDGGPSSQVVFPQHPEAQRALGLAGQSGVADMVALVPV